MQNLKNRQRRTTTFHEVLEDVLEERNTELELTKIAVFQNYPADCMEQPPVEWAEKQG